MPLLRGARGRVTIKIEKTNVLELDQVVPVALIVSELVANGLKHAFRDRSQGHIAIGFRRSPESKEYVLTVADNGCGGSLDGSGGSLDGKGLGKMIIRGLVAQLQAKISYENKNGTSVTVKIPTREAVLRPD